MGAIHPPSQHTTRQARRPNRRRGVALALVLIAAVISATLAYAYLGTQSTSVGIARNVRDHARARYVAESGLALAVAYVQSDADWRTDQSNGPWVTDVPLAGGTFTLRGEDGDGIEEGDGDLADDSSDALTLTVIGSVNGISHVTRAVLTPNGGVAFEAGVTTAGDTARTVSLANTYTSPVVVCTINYRNNSVPVVPRVSNVTATSFDVRLQNPSGRPVTSESVSYAVMEEGAWEIGGLKCEAQRYTSTRTDRSGSWVGEQQTYGQEYANPVVLGQVMTENDRDWSVFWCRGTSITNPPSATRLYTGKTVCEDTDTTRANEIIGFIVFESGNGAVGGVPFETGLGRDIVCGVGDRPPYVYDFNVPFSTAPAVAIASQAAMDGGNGGWALSYGSTPTTTSQLRLAIDEDQIRDSERNHAAEQVGYLVLESPVHGAAGNEVNFGYEAELPEEEGRTEEQQIATQVTLNGNGVLTALTADVKGPPSKELRYAVYTDAGGEPGALVVETNAEPIGSNDYHWHRINTTPTALTAGTYWLALAFEHQNMYYRYASSGGQTRVNGHDAVARGYSSPWGSSTASNTRQISIYATYTPTSGSGGGPGYTIDWRD